MEPQFPNRTPEEELEFKARINETAQHEIEWAVSRMKDSREDSYGGMVIKDNAGIIARAIISELNGRGGVELYFDEEINEQIIYTAREIVVEGMKLPNPYETIEQVTMPKPDHPSKLDMAMHNVHYSFAELSMQNRDRQIMEVMTAAVTWGEREDLTPMERCQGLAHEFYSDWGIDSVLTADGTSVPSDPGRAYARMYDHEFADKIKDRSMRAAKDLFGSKA